MGYDKKKTPVLDPEDGYNKFGAEYEKGHAFLDTFEQGYFKWLNRDFTGKKVLDVGSATGRNTIRLLEMGGDITAVDVSEKMVELLQSKKPQIHCVHADARDLPFEDDSFDVVTSHLTMVHLKKPEEALDEFYRVLKNDGELFLTIIHEKRPALLKVEKDKFFIESFYHSAKSIRKILEELAFTIVEERPIKEEKWVISTIFHCKK